MKDSVWLVLGFTGLIAVIVGGTFVQGEYLVAACGGISGGFGLYLFASYKLLVHARQIDLTERRQRQQAHTAFLTDIDEHGFS